MIAKLGRQFKIDARIFSAASHVFSLLYGNAAHALSLNDICDALMVHEPEFLRVRGATPPARNTFSNANRTGLLMHLILRFLRHVSRWGHSFSRCAGIVRAALWVKADLVGLLHCYGTAGGPHQPVLYEKQPCLPGFEAFSSRPVGQHG